MNHSIFKLIILSLLMLLTSLDSKSQTVDCSKAFTKKIAQNKRLERWRSDKLQTKFVLLHQGMHRAVGAQLNYRDGQIYLTLLSESSSTIVARAYALTPRQQVHLYFGEGLEIEIEFPQEGLDYRKLQAKFYRNDIPLTEEQLQMLCDYQLLSFEIENPFDAGDTDSATKTIAALKRIRLQERAQCFRERIQTEPSFSKKE
ncbi:MAG: hypothetical protein AAF587_23115 [Bacteroidota bacterium]